MNDEGIDHPANIKTYPSALRYVVKHIVPDKPTVERIQRMRQHQDAHEKQWHAGRIAIQQKFKARIEGRKKLDSVMMLIGEDQSTTLERDIEAQDKADEEQELKNYDAKVYKASIAMVKSMSTELASLGIPFFVTNEANTEPDPELKIKMIQLLEDVTS
ncbi:hypothetical protein V1514DRAFT_317593 [Lipomyces japonicus]|uniref:uncharacterized protein n=1 Tax=Lipomyces japonicus TaxID=56871 RepID=UPI0034CE4D26